MLSQLIDIPSDVRRDAARIIERQEGVPKSPLGRSSGGSIELCAAAALAVANTAPHVRKVALIERMEAEGVSALLDAFDDCGWGRNLASRVLLANDSLEPRRRKEGVLQMLTPPGHSTPIAALAGR